MKPHVRCKMIWVRIEDFTARAGIKLVDPHPKLGAVWSDEVITSPLESIDFARGIMETRNTIYLFKLV